MNILVLTFGCKLLEDYYSKCLKNIFDTDENLLFTDISRLEHEMILRKIEYDKSESLAMNLIASVPVTNSVIDRINKIIKQNCIDSIICLDTEAIWYVDSVKSQYCLNIPVYCLLSDISGINRDFESISKYYVLSEYDRQKALKAGIDTDKITVSGLPGSSKAGAGISMHFDDDMCLFITDGNDFYRLAACFDSISASSLRKMNFIVAVTQNRDLCDIFNARYYNSKNIRAVCVRNNLNDYIASADFAVVDTCTDDVMYSIINNIPLIVIEENINSPSLLKFLNDRNLAFSVSKPEDVAEKLTRLVSNLFLRNAMVESQGEITNTDSDNIIRNDIINNLFT